MKAFYESNMTDPFYNLAWEQYLMENKIKGDIRILLWQNDSTVVVGRYQNVYEEVNIEFLKNQKINLVRRNSGGGAVFHDSGNINYSFILDNDDRVGLDMCISILKETLLSFGLAVCQEGRNDLSVDGAKVSGIAQYMKDGTILCHGTLLVNSDIDKMKVVLTRNTKIQDRIAKKSEPRPVANICQLSNGHVTVERLLSALRKRLVTEKFTFSNDINNEAIVSIMEKKYHNPEWNYGFRPHFQFKNGKRFEGGNVYVCLNSSNGIIDEIHFYGDFFANKDIKEFENKLRGQELSEDIVDIIKNVGGDEYILGVQSEDIVSLISDVTTTR